MRNKNFKSNNLDNLTAPNSEQGAALVVAIMVMLLLAAFVTLVVSRVTTETVITGVDSSENRAIAATMGSLESTTRDFADVFQRKLSPTNADIANVEALPMPITQLQADYLFTKRILPTSNSQATEITGGIYSGLYALRDEYEVDITAKDRNTGIETQLKRRFLNDRIPLFQFGIFFEDDLELNRPPLFTFGGRVHTNKNFFVSASPVSSSGGIYFKSKATAHGELVNDIWKTRTALTSGTDDQNGVFIADAGGTNRELLTGRGSVKCVSPSGANVFGDSTTDLYNPNLPNCSRRAAWSTDKTIFQGNLEVNAPRLDLPLFRLNIDLTELIKRSKNVGDMTSDGTNVSAVTSANQDLAIVSRERFANKEGLRISLADSRDRLPGCVGFVGQCGAQLNGSLTNGTGGNSLGYKPRAMQDGYQATAMNGTRIVPTWIKVEMVAYDFNNSVPITTDITEDFLSLGVTERAPIKSSGTNLFQINGYGLETLPDTSPQKTDIRSIIKLQRFTIPGVAIPNASSTAGNVDFNTTNRTIGTSAQNLVVKYTSIGTNTALNPSNGCSTSIGPPLPLNYCGVANNTYAPTFPTSLSTTTAEDNYHLKSVRYAATGVYTNTIVPFPIQMFDTREGIPTDNSSQTSLFNNNVVPTAGVMSMVDIDVANLRKFFNGDFNNLFPTTTPYAISKGPGSSLVAADVPNNKGWVLFVSDRRGDADFDGEYDMEDVFPDNVLEYNEDVNNNGVLDRRLCPGVNCEAPTYSDSVNKSRAATTDHSYYRRGVRLINGTLLPGIYNVTTPNQSLGFTLASENGVYVQGNYNVTSVTLPGGSAPAPSQNYLPQNTVNQIPAAIASDAVTILSNNWDDSKSFAFPFTQANRVATATQVRFAMLTGDGITGNTTISFAPSGFGQLNGGIHNFKRYLEQWTGVRLNYAGSLVNLFNSRNNNGFWKCCNAVYNPPIRDWTFDTTFLDPNRLPPGTPYIYSMTFTGFQRVNN
jgi:hypothetical protein